MGRRRQLEIGEAVVDEVELRFTLPEVAMAQGEFGRIADEGLDAMRREQLLEPEELGIQVLALGLLIDDGERLQFASAALGTEHRDKSGKDVLPVGLQRGEQAAAGIGVDLDELRPRGRQVKVVAHEDARGRRPPRADFAVPRRQRDDALDRGDQRLHAGQIAGRDRHCRR
jgi:hypothetical protein